MTNQVTAIAQYCPPVKDVYCTVLASCATLRYADFTFTVEPLLSGQ